MRLQKLSAVVALAFLLGAAHPSSAGLIFSDNFDAENGGVAALNYGSFANWTVSDGTVDLIGNGSFDFQPGNGLYVDMDGSTGNAGKLTTQQTFTFVNGANYTLSFWLAGNLRSSQTDSVAVVVTVGNFSQSFSLPYTTPFTPYSFTFVGNGTQGQLSFEGSGGDNIGMLLDNVQLSVPDGGATLALLGCALVGLGILRRRLGA